MEFSVTADANWETRTSRILHELARNEGFFLAKRYGDGVRRIGLVLMCRDPALGFKRRARFYKDRLAFYVDIMLDYERMVAASMIERMAIVAEEIFAQLTSVLAKRKFADFDVASFLRDLRGWLDEAKADYDGHGSGAWKY